MEDMVKCAAARLNIPFPFQAEVAKSQFDGKKLSTVKKSGNQLLPFLPELLDEIAVIWAVEGWAIQQETSHHEKFPAGL